MVFATYVFFILFWVYGVVPHQWLTWADSELNWRPDRFIVGPELPLVKGIVNFLNKNNIWNKKRLSP